MQLGKEMLVAEPQQKRPTDGNKYLCWMSTVFTERFYVEKRIRDVIKKKTKQDKKKNKKTNPVTSTEIGESCLYTCVSACVPVCMCMCV